MSHARDEMQRTGDDLVKFADEYAGFFFIRYHFDIIVLQFNNKKTCKNGGKLWVLF